MNRIFYILIIVVTISNQAYSETDNLNLITEWFSGEFNTTEQAKADSQYMDISLTVSPFSIADQPGKWFFLEISFTNDKNRPYRQEVYHFEKGEMGIIILNQYNILKGNSFRNTFINDSLSQKISIDQLQKREVCSIYILKKTDIFAGTTTGNKCISTIRNSKYSKTDIEITKVDFFLWEKGYDARNKQVWGSNENGYIFKKFIDSKSD